MSRAARAIPSALVVALLAVAGRADAVVLLPNGSFETGTTASWTTAGQVSVVTSSYGVTPTDNTYQVLLTTGGSAIKRKDTETAMGIPNNSIKDIFETYLKDTGLSTGKKAKEGSAIQVTFSADSGDELLFDWDFLTDERVSTPPDRSTPDPLKYTDFVWSYLEPPTGAAIDSLVAHANQPAADFSSSSTPFAHETGYMTFSTILTQTGSYTLTVGVHDVKDDFIDSGVVFDWFRLKKAPEPDTFGLLGLGLLGLGVYGRRGGRSSAMRPKSSTTFVRTPSPRSSR